ncbi:hypothetical protein QL285_074861 [Trifolium repens]|nr:hypothetical protein QL285_074861 [Trifolium repens]
MRKKQQIKRQKARAPAEAPGAEVVGADVVGVNVADGAGGDLAEAFVTIKVDSSNYKRVIAKGIVDNPNARIMFEYKKYKDCVLRLIQGEISSQNEDHGQNDKFNLVPYLEMGLRDLEKKMTHMIYGRRYWSRATR